MHRILYIYGITPASTLLDGAPRGVEGEAVELVPEGELGALVSRLPAGAYQRERLEPLLGDVSWLGERAVAHDAVITWASERGGVIPTPMFTLYSDEETLRAMLRERAQALGRTLQRVVLGEEYGVRVFRLDAELAQHLDEWSPSLARLAAQAEEASPGQRYLLQRKLESERAVELRRVAAEVTQDVFDTLAPHALDAVREAVPRVEEGTVGLAALNAYFLVRRGTLEHFRRVLTELATRYEPRGFRIEFTGPWAPYHFVRQDA